MTYTDLAKLETKISAWWDDAEARQQERVAVAAGYDVAKLWRSEWWIAGYYGKPYTGCYRINKSIRARLRRYINQVLRLGIESLPQVDSRCALHARMYGVSNELLPRSLVRGRKPKSKRTVRALPTANGTPRSQVRAMPSVRQVV